MHPHRLPLVWIVAALVAAAVGGQARPAARAGENASLRSAAASITTDDLRRHAEVLANDTFEGREAGSRGGRAAAGYLLGQLKRHGLRGAATNGGFYQAFGADYRNLLALIEGSDPTLKSEVILVGAHFDHVGYGTYRNSYGPTGYIHNGADDNASGVATLMEVAEAVVLLEPRPKRSILFALWDGEEKGLLGSKHWVANPTVPLHKIRCAVNMDMVGRMRNDRLEVSGARTAGNLRRLVSLQNEGPSMLLDFTWEIKDNSDHYSFYSRGVPFIMFHTGLHDDYHRPSDDVDKLQIEGMRRVASLLLGVVHELGDAPALPGFRTAVRTESTYTQHMIEAPLAPLPGRLGVAWAPDDAVAPGLRVTRVTPGSAAAAAGVRTGDRIVRFAGHELAAGDDFTGLVLAAENPVAATVARAGEMAPLELTIQLAGQPVEVGIAWRDDDAEGGSVKLVRVVPGSPAAKAGLRVLDRVYEVNGASFANGHEFLNLLSTHERPLRLLVERRGKLHTLSIGATAD